MSSSNKIDMVYMDPPYYSLHSDNEYVRRYHFVEGIACNWQGVEMQWHTKTKKFKTIRLRFLTKIMLKMRLINCLPDIEIASY